MFASVMTYVSSELVNAFIISRMKIIQRAKGFQLRAVVSTVGAQAVDCFVFYPIAFWGIISPHNLIETIFNSWFIKVALEVIALPVTTLVVKYIKRLEGIEHFDKNPDA